MLCGPISILKEKLPACHNQFSDREGGKTVFCNCECNVSGQCFFSKRDVFLQGR